MKLSTLLADYRQISLGVFCSSAIRGSGTDRNDSTATKFDDSVGVVHILAEFSRPVRTTASHAGITSET